ncbi:MAG: IPT/TIG domain-containing protein, partial [Pyrinomonadaceae bacterium]
MASVTTPTRTVAPVRDLAQTTNLFAPAPQPMFFAGTVSLTTLGTAYTENFDTLANTGTSSTVPTGWNFTEAGGNTSYTAGTGSSATGDTYSFGATSATDRALGTLRSGSVVTTITATFQNNTGSTITSLNVGYTGEQWRSGATGRGDLLSVDIDYNNDGTMDATPAGLVFVTPNTTVTGAKDGNAAGFRQVLSLNLSGLNITNGTTFVIRWTDFDATGADDGLAIDDFSLTPAGPISSGNITMNGNGLPIANGSTTPSLLDHTDFGSVTVGANGSRNFVIGNAHPTQPLNLTGSPSFVSISGAAAGDFSVTLQPTSPVPAGTGGCTVGCLPTEAPNAEGDYTIQFLPTTTGTRSATVTIANSDTANNPFTFAIQGEGVVSNNAKLSGITLTGPSTTISPSFDPNFAGPYGATVANSVSSITVNGTAQDANGSVSINGGSYAVGSNSASVSLPIIGLNAITVTGKAQDGTTNVIYTVNITRSSDSTLAGDFFRSAGGGGGNWGTPATWQSSHDGSTNWITATLSPTTAANTITVRSPDNVTVAASVSADQLTINSGGAVTIGNARTLTIVDGTGTDLTNNGVVSIALSSATLINNGSFANNDLLLIQDGTSTFTGNAPVYGSSSNLRYDGASTVGAEWTASPGSGTAGAGQPANVTCNPSSVVTMPGTERSVAGNLETIIFSGLTLNAPLNLYGNWVDANGATATFNGNVVALRGGAGQTISKSGSVSKPIDFLTINKTAGAVTLLVPVTISGQLTLTAGNILTNSSNLLTVTNTAAGAVSGGSSASFVNGPFARLLPSGLVTGSTYVLPIGKGNYDPLTLVNPTTTIGGDVRAEVFDANSGGTAGTGLNALKTNRYWRMINNAEDITGLNTQVRLTDSTVGATDLVGYVLSGTPAATYNSIGGSVSGSEITSTTQSMPFGFFNIGTPALVAPTVTSVNPTSGTTAGGNSVTITGTGFTGVTAVTFGGAACTSINFVSDTEINCTAPAHAAGAVSVVVTTPGGTNAANTLYTYVLATTTLANLTVASTAWVGNNLPVSTTLTQTSAPAGAIGGATVSFTLNGPSGTSMLSTTTDVSGFASVSFPLTVKGAHTVTANFAGNSTQAAAASNTPTVDVYQRTSLTMGAASGTAGVPVSVSATLTSVPGGLPVAGQTVNFTFSGGPGPVSAVTDAAGVATVAPVYATAGSSNTNASFFNPSEFFADDSGNIVPETAASTVNIGLAVSALADLNVPATGLVGDPLTVSTTLTRTSPPPGAVSGTVTFTFTSPSSAVTNQTVSTDGSGLATVAFTPTERGTYSVVANYAGSSTLAPSISNTPGVGVYQRTALAFAGGTGVAGSPTTLTATLTEVPSGA